MLSKLHLRHSAWSVVDQGVVSGGAFFMNLLLARALPAVDYGVFVIVFGGMLTLQLFSATLLFHPLSVRLATAAPSDRDELMRSSLILVAVLSIGLGLFLAVVLCAFGHPGLALPALACFVAWQMQEAVRRGLLTEFRLKAAALGDGVSYIGQAVAVLFLALTDTLTLPGVLWCMAVTSLGAAALQLWQFGLVPGPAGLRQTLAAYWQVGGPWSLGNAMVSQLRLQILPWLLAAGGGPAAAAAFQAVVNVINLSNPITISLGNVIPQTAARASAAGAAAAWHASRGYALLATPPILGYALVVLTFPGALLWLLYGSGSGYLHLELAVRILIVASAAGYATDVVIAFLHGIVEIRAAFRINAIGAVAAAVLAVPLVSSLGVVGAVMAVFGSNLMRLAAAYLVMVRLTDAAATATP